MFKKVGDGLLTGLGAVVLTRDKIEEATQKLVHEAKLTKEEAQKLNQELLMKGDNQWKSFEQAVVDGLHTGRDKLGIARQDEVAALKQRVEALEAKVTLLASLVEAKQAAAKAESES